MTTFAQALAAKTVQRIQEDIESALQRHMRGTLYHIEAEEVEQAVRWLEAIGGTRNGVDVCATPDGLHLASDHGTGLFVAAKKEGAE